MRSSPNGKAFTLEIGEIAIQPGSTALIAGPNGSGKTTLVEALLGLRSDYKVDARIAGVPVANLSPRDKAQLGILFQEQRFSKVVKVSDIISLHTRLFGGRSEELLERLHVSSISNQAYGRLSGGERQRVHLYFALAHKPLLAILDEPEASIDDETKTGISELLGDRQKSGYATVISTHERDFARIATDILCLKRGRVEFFGDSSGFLKTFMGTTVAEVLFESAEHTERFINEVRGNGFLTGILRAGERSVTVFGDEITEKLIRTHMTGDMDCGLLVRPAAIEDVFLYLSERFTVERRD